LEEKLCREGTEDRVVEYSIELCQVGIEQVQVCTRELCFKFREKSVKEKTLQSFEHSVSSARSALSKCKECTEPILI
jgi:hypothetical protein